MPYDFTAILDRRGRDSVAADRIPIPDAAVREGITPIPMWIADMSFPVAPRILEAMQERLAFPSLGYFPMPQAWYDAVIDWQRRRNGVEGLLPERIGYENGVLGGVSSAIQMLTAPGEKILLHSPTYVGFTHVLENTGRVALHSPLRRDAGGIWRMDFEDMERKLREERIHLAIFCSPHNPTGRVWERWELERAMALFAEYDCRVISDEIWSDIVMPGYRHIPTQSVSEDAKRRTLAFYAPSKTFSLAGLVGSYHIVYDDALRDGLRRRSALSHYNSPNILSVHALIAAYNKCEDWVDEMRRVIDGNFALACGHIGKNWPGVSLMRPQGTYMIFPDCGAWCDAAGLSFGELLRRGVEAGVVWQNGEDFFGERCIRMNLALPTAALEEALRRLDEVFKA